MLDCVGSKTGRCSPDGGTDLVQTFTVSSSVNFIKVPPVPPPAKTR